MGPMFRYDRPQKGRYRQFYQYGVEYLGSHSPYSDAEVISLAYLFLKNLGLKNFDLEINSIGNPASSQNYDNALIKYFSPHKEELCPDCKIRLEKNPKRILDCKIPTCKEIATNVPSMLDYLDEESLAHFETVKKYLTLMQIPYKINPKIVRGLDYYTNTAFEVINNSLGAQNAILGGGRYDGLTKQLGGKDVPGIGFAGGFERLILSMEQEGLSFGKKPKPYVYLAAIGENVKDKAIEIIHFLRLNEINAEYYFEKNSMKSQMKVADKLNVNKTLILGEEELVENKINIKDMKTGEQITIPIENLLSELKK
jgi:histidyl-tRNA synthetase